MHMPRTAGTKENGRVLFPIMKKGVCFNGK